MAYKEKNLFGASVARPAKDKKPFARKLVRVSNAIEKDVKNEARVVESLREMGSHQNIVEVLKHGWLETSGKVYFIDMELADATLADYIDYVFHEKTKQPSSPHYWPPRLRFFSRPVGPLQTLPAMFEIGHAIANGLEFLHINGHVHRDLKPQNGNIPFDHEIV